MALVNVKLAAGAFTEKQKHDMAARLTDVMVAFEGSEAFREVIWVLIEEIQRDGWHIGGQPFFGPPSLDGRPGPVKSRVRGRRRDPDHPCGPGHSGPGPAPMTEAAPR